MVTAFDKAIVAVLVPLIILGVNALGLHADQTWVDALTVVLTGVIVWLVPNKATA